MSIPQKKKNANAFVDFVPAELRKGSRWQIVYYAHNPYTNQLERKRHRVRPMNSLTERKKLASRMVLNINQKLQSGWNPFVEDNNSKSFVKLTDSLDSYLSKVRKEIKKGERRKDTLRTYTSYISILKTYLNEQNLENMFVFSFNEKFIQQFLDYIYYDRENSSRTRNNYLGFIITFGSYLKRNDYIGKNPAESITKLSKKEKTRKYIPIAIRKSISTYFKQSNNDYWTLCLLCYYCFIRRTEMTKLKVSDVVIKNDIIFLNSDVSKNKKSQAVSIPAAVSKRLEKHILGHDGNLFLFSTDFKPGTSQLRPKKISDTWSRMREVLKLESNIQWYSLKDSGITDLLLKGVKPIHVSNQARHHSIKQTEEYIPRDMIQAEKTILENDSGF